MITTEKIHDQPPEGEGTRILVDRLWPRGVKKATAPVDEWLKSLAPLARAAKRLGTRSSALFRIRRQISL